LSVDTLRASISKTMMSVRACALRKAVLDVVFADRDIQAPVP
jgi:hypothetical protein